MPLFSRLVRLYPASVPLEDFFTEIIAHLFDSSQAIFRAWVEHFDIMPPSETAFAAVSTQRHFDCLAHHATDSRIDMVVEREDGAARDVIFVESKIGSLEGKDQLERYAEHLAAMTAVRHRILVYITRDYDNKEPANFLKGTTVQFRPLRWHAMYTFFRSQPAEPLIAEILTFMEAHRMAQSNQFSTHDLAALSSIELALKLMRATLDDPIRSRFSGILGSLGRRQPDLDEIHHRGRYLLSIGFDVGQWWCGLGYLLRPSNLDNYPRLVLMLEVDPRSRQRPEMIAAMRQIAARPGWLSYLLDDARAWSGVTYVRSMRDFLAHPDHLAAIQAHFAVLLDELVLIKREYSHLPWSDAPPMQSPGETIGGSVGT